MLVSHDRTRWLSAAEAVANLQTAIENWSTAALRLAEVQRRVDDGEGELFDARAAESPFPRGYQWLDGSAFLAHGRLMTRAFKLEKNAQEDETPLMYQGMSDRFLPPQGDVFFPAEELGIDFEGEFAVVTDAVPMGTTAAAALDHVRLLLLLNDWSLRSLAPREMRTGFGFLQAKPATSFAPLALTPDELGEHWLGGKLDLTIKLWRSDKLFGAPPSTGMDFSFAQLIAYAARTRALSAGTIIGSGTVSAGDPFGVGSTCISEARGQEMIDHGAAHTPFLRFGETVRIEAFDSNGVSVFGALDQRVAEG